MALELIDKEPARFFCVHGLPKNYERAPPPSRSASDATQAGSRELRNRSPSGLAMGGGMAAAILPTSPVGGWGAGLHLW